MEDLGQADGRLVAAAAPPVPALSAWGLSALVIALVASLAAWPFALDDALISVRYARHLASGAGYVWNVGGPSTDGVTPLPWAFVLAPLAHASPLVVLSRAKLLGATSWALAAAVWGRAVGALPRPWWAKAVAFIVLGVALPVAAHAVSGMETALAMTLATCATLSWERPWRGAFLAGLAATLRPELLPWSIVLGVGYAVVATRELGSRKRAVREASVSCALAAAPFVACALARVMVFGSPAPLSVLAKPSDASHGLAYVGAALVFALAPVLVMAPFVLVRERGHACVLVLAGGAHCLALVAVGGDWMPYARLMAPIVPSLLYAFVLLTGYRRPAAHVARAALVLSFGLWAFAHHLGILREAGANRRSMIDAASSLFEGAHVVAALDIGWVSAVTESTIIDLAGVTDPEVAALGGGHTSKRVDPSFLLARKVDCVVFYADTPTSEPDPHFPRVVEARLAAAPLFQEHYVETARLPLGQGAGYIIYRSR